MRAHLHDVNDLRRRRERPLVTRFLNMCRQLELVCLVRRGVVKTNYGSVQVEICMESHGVPYILRQPETLGKEHEEARQDVVELPVSLPEGPVVDIVGPVGRFRAVDVLQDLVEDEAHDSGAGKGGILRPLDALVQGRAFYFLALVEGFFSAWQPRGDLQGVSSVKSFPLKSHSISQSISRSHHTSVTSIRFGHPVLILAWLSMQNTPQKHRRRSSSSTQLWGGARVGVMSLASSESSSSRWSPIMWMSLTHFAQLIPARVKNRRRASAVAVNAQACRWGMVRKCSPYP